MSLRSDLAEWQHKLRQAQREVANLQAEVENAAIIAAGGVIGDNAESRKRNLVLALAASGRYNAKVAYTEDCQYHIDLLVAEIKTYEDDFKERRLTSDDRLTARPDFEELFSGLRGH